MENFVNIGKSVKRVDAFEKVTGTALYLDDLKFPGLLHGKVLRSPYAHARILSVDTKEAERLPGVKAVVTGKEFNALGGEAVRDCPFIAVDKVRYVGEAVAAVAAVSEEIAEDALDLIKVEYEELPIVLDPIEAMKEEAPKIHEDIADYKHIPVINPIPDSNICHYMEVTNGDVEQGFKESDYIFEDTFTTQMQQHAAIEPHAAIVQMNPEGNILIWVTNDSPHRLRKDLANAMGVSLSKIRIVIPPFLGGGFGGKGGIKVESIGIVLASKTNFRPVKIVLTREEVFTSALVRHPSVIKIKTGVKKDGKILSREMNLVYDTGAYSEKGPTVSQKGTYAAVGPFNIPNVKIKSYCVYTNKPVAGAYRGYGVPQVTWAHESQMDIIAEKLNIDPVKIRLINALEEGDRSPTKHNILHSVGLKDCLKKLSEYSCNKNSNNNKSKVGWGVACGWEDPKTPSGSSAIVKMNLDESVEVLTSTIEVGQGSKTVFSQIASEELGIPMEKIYISANADTDKTPYDASTTASRSTFHMGNAIVNACIDVKQQLKEMAAEILNISTENLAIGRGFIYVIEDEDKKLFFGDIIKTRYKAGIDIIGRGSYYPKVDKKHAEMWGAPAIFTMYGAQLAEVEVNTETGRFKVNRVIAAHDVGQVVNLSTCEGQIEGGVLMGIGNATFEEMLIDKNGRVTNPSFLDYKIPSALDMTDIDSIFVEATHKEGPFGAKGIGEIALVPTAPAIANAIYNAVGIRIKDLPITPDKILKLLKKQ